MSRFVLYLLTTLELTLVVWGGRLHQPILPDLPPPVIFTTVENNFLELNIGESATVREGVAVNIDCGQQIDDVINTTGINPRVTWYKNGIILTNGSERNIVISEDERLCIISATSLAVGGELGTSGNYTCRVCAGDSTADCLVNSSHQYVCGVPHLVPPPPPPPVNQTVELLNFIQLVCGQDVTVPTLVGVSSIIISCEIFNGSEPFTTAVYKDGTLVGDRVPHLISNPTGDDFSTYTVRVSTENCGVAQEVSRILQEGDPPVINKIVAEKPTTEPENKRVDVGNPVNVSRGFNLTIDCIVISGTPPIAVTWIRNDNELISSSEGNSSSITINVTDAYDGDNITCRADNNIGYDNATTTINVQVCDINCMNGGNRTENCTCECYPGYEGNECQDDINECDPNPCKNNATCTDFVNNYTCNCTSGYTGVNCEINIDECDPNPCENEGTCTDLINNYTCMCTEDFGGRICTIYIGKCPDNYMTVSVGFRQSSYSVDEDDGFVTLTLFLSSEVGCSCYTSVAVTTVEMSATRGDYGHRTHIPVMIPDGSTYAEFEIPIINDNDYEANEEFCVTIDPLSLPYGVILGSTADTVVTIMDDDSATVKFKEVGCSINESDGSIEHALVLNKPLFTDVTIEVITVSQSTQRDCDYDPGPYNVTLPAGQIEVPFNASINDDDVFESDETFQLVVNHRTLPNRISRAEPYSSTVTIMDDEEPIKVKFSQSNYEVNEHEGPAQPTLVLSKPSPCCLHVLVEVMDHTATRGHDYDPGRMRLNITFPIGVTCAPFNISLIDDVLSEDNETFNISILEESLPFGVILDDPDKTTVTIVENDFYLNFGKENFTVYEDDGFAEVVLVLDKEADADFVIYVMDRSNTATGDVDYVTGPYNATMIKGETRASLFVGIINDTVYENGDDDRGEDFDLEIITGLLPDGVYPGNMSATKVIIVDDEYEFCFGSTTYLFDESVGTAVMSLRLTRPLRKDIMVNFTYEDFIASGNHTAATNESIDYYTSYVSPNYAIIPAGTQDFLLDIEIVSDGTLENNELFRIHAGNPDGDSCYTDVIIRDDDDFRITFEEASYTVTKNGDVVVKLLLIYPEVYNGAIMFPINVTVDEINITATGGYEDNPEGVDYVYQNYNLSFEDGETSKSLIIRTIDDNIVEPDENYTLVIAASTVTTGFSPGIPNGRVIVGENGTTTITILNDDVTTLRIDMDKNTFEFFRSLSEDVYLNVTYNDRPNSVYRIATGDTSQRLLKGVKEVEVIVPNVFRKDSIKVSEDSKIPIIVTFIEQIIFTKTF